jgi:hypothetical protein
MIKTIAIFTICGVAYLYALEHIGNFITRGLPSFEAKILLDPELGLASEKFENRDAYWKFLLRHDLADLVELMIEQATDDEWKRLHD